MLAKDLKEILELMRNDGGAGSKKEERLALEIFIKQLEKVIREEKMVRNQIETNPDKDAVKNEQRDVAQNTQDLENKIPGKGGKGGEPKEAKGKSKEPGKGAKAEGKGRGKESDAPPPGEGKKPAADGGEAKPASPEPNDENPKGKGEGDAKAEAKSDKSGDSAKAGESKDGQGSDSGKAGSDKQGKGPDADKAGQGKDGGDKGDKQASGAKGENKPSDASKPGASKTSKDAGASKEAGGSKGSEGSKAGSESKPGSPSPGGQGDSKPGKSSEGKGSAKSSPSAGGGDKPGEKPAAPDVAGGKGDNEPAKAGANQSKDNAGMDSARKKIKEAQEHMDRVTDEIAKNKDKAGAEADKAVAKLEEARRRLEDLLRQMREEELDRVLAALISRCQKMLAMQEEVLRGTLNVQAQAEVSPAKTKDRKIIQDCLNLSDDELRIVHEATKAIEILETEGSAVAFPEVFQQVREDMKHVQRRLKNTDVGDVTVTIEQDVVETLREMIKALEKAKKDLDNKKQDPKKSEPQEQKQQDQKLLDKIAELKILKAMQLRVNSRTELYSKHYDGEQANAENIRLELRELAGRAGADCRSYE